MSKANPEWYELPRDRWTETTKDEDGFFHSQWRDSQRSKIYHSERQLKNYLQNMKIPIKEFENNKEIAKFVNRILQSAWVKRRWGNQKLIKITVCNRRNESFARSWNSEISINPKMKNILVVLHEMAHILSDCGTPHGRHFARTFLELLEHEMGLEVKKLLKERFVRNGVKFTPFIKYSKETLKKMQERGKQLAATYLKTEKEDLTRSLEEVQKYFRKQIL